MFLICSTCVHKHIDRQSNHSTLTVHVCTGLLRTLFSNKHWLWWNTQHSFMRERLVFKVKNIPSPSSALFGATSLLGSRSDHHRLEAQSHLHTVPEEKQSLHHLHVVITHTSTSSSFACFKERLCRMVEKPVLLGTPTGSLPNMKHLQGTTTFQTSSNIAINTGKVDTM